MRAIAAWMGWGKGKPLGWLIAGFYSGVYSGRKAAAVFN
jgi:hypothetical protein